MKAMFASAIMLITGGAEAHEAFAPHGHPHDISWLPGTEAVGVAALLLSVAVIAYTQFRRR